MPISTQEDFIRAIVADGVDTHQWVQPTTPASFGTQLLGLDLDLTEQRCYAAIVNTMQALAPSVDPLTAIDRAADTTGQRYSHGGSTGQLVLSRTPITDTSVFAPEGFLARTATVYATVRGVRMAFADWPHNVLGDFDSTYAFALQPAYAADVLATAPDVVVGTLQSGRATSRRPTTRWCRVATPRWPRPRPTVRARPTRASGPVRCDSATV